MTREQYVIHLLKCALLGLQPQEKPEIISFDEIFAFSKAHMIANTIWYSIDKLNVKPDEKLWNEWTEFKNHAIVKDIKQRNEYKNIISAIDKAKIPCVPVKGIFLKKYYPRTEFRTMSDIDIYVDEKNIPKIKEILLSLGFTCESEGMCHHDAFMKPPVMDVEIHRELISENLKELNVYYKDVFSKTRLVDGYQYVHEMNEEEFYIYVLAHFYKHYKAGGSGIRSVMDMYVLNNSLYDSLDKESLNLKLKQLKMRDFRDKITDLSQWWFGDGHETKELQTIASYILSSGTYGTVANHVNNQINEFGRFGFILYNVFLPYDIMKYRYHILKRVPVLLPFCWIIRWGRGILTKQDVIKYKLKSVFYKEGMR